MPILLFFRKALFYVFAAAYLIFCPLLVFYALGYSYRPGVEKRIVKTGLIHLSSVPTGAAIYLDNKRFPEKTPAMIRGLLPGDYTVRLHLKNHELWEDTVPVEVEKATAIDKVLLLRRNPRLEKLAQGPFRELIPMEGTHFFLVSTGSKAGDLLVVDWRAGARRPLLDRLEWGPQEKDPLFSNSVLYSFLGNGLIGFQPYADGKKALVWRKNALGILSFLPDEKTEETRDPRAELDWIFKEGRDVRQAFWLHEGSHVLFRDGSQTFLAECRKNRMARIRRLFTSMKNSAIFYAEETGKVYYLDAAGDLYALEILPKGQAARP